MLNYVEPLVSLSLLSWSCRASPRWSAAALPSVRHRKRAFSAVGRHERVVAGTRRLQPAEPRRRHRGGPHTIHPGHRPHGDAAPRRALREPRRQGRGAAAVLDHRPCTRVLGERAVRRGLPDGDLQADRHVARRASVRRSRPHHRRRPRQGRRHRDDQPAITLRPDDASLRFAAALVAATADRTAYRDHADKARKGAAQDTLLARNIGKLS